MGIFSKSQVDTMQADIATMTKRREKLGVEHGKAVKEAAEAARKRSALLVEQDDAVGTPAFEKVDKAYAFAEGRRVAIESAMRDLAERIQANEETIAGVHDQKERARLADRLEARAAEIEKAAHSIDAAGKQMASAIVAMQDVLTRSGIASVNALSGTEVSAKMLLRPIAVSAMRKAAPGLGHQDSQQIIGMPPIKGSVVDGGSVYGGGAVAAAIATQVQPLRTWAARIRSGEALAEEPHTPPPVEVAQSRVEETSIVLSESVYFHGVSGRQEHRPEGNVTLPVPVAEAAIAKGVGFRHGSQRATAIMQELQKADLSGMVGKMHKPSEIVRRGPPWKDLDFNLRDWIAVESARIDKERAA